MIFQLQLLYLGFLLSVNANETRAGLQLPDGTDLRQVKVLRRDEFNRIHDNIYAKEQARQQAIRDRQEKQKYYAEAKELIKNWPNTIIVNMRFFPQFLRHFYRLYFLH